MTVITKEWAIDFARSKYCREKYQVRDWNEYDYHWVIGAAVYTLLRDNINVLYNDVNLTKGMTLFNIPVTVDYTDDFVIRLFKEVK